MSKIDLITNTNNNFNNNNNNQKHLLKPYNDDDEDDHVNNYLINKNEEDDDEEEEEYIEEYEDDDDYEDVNEEYNCDIENNQQKSHQQEQQQNEQEEQQMPINICSLNWEQVKQLDDLLNHSIPIHGRGNFPTLNVSLKDFIRNLKRKLINSDVFIKDVRINGGVASYILTDMTDYQYSDIDIIFCCTLVDDKINNFDKIKQCVFDCLLDYLPSQAKKDKISSIHLKEAYVMKMVKVCDNDIWSLISLCNNDGQNIELKFVDKMRRQFQFSVDSFQIHLNSLLDYYDFKSNSSNSLKNNNSSSSTTTLCDMNENFYPKVIAESLYGNFIEAKTHLDNKLIATKLPEEIRGGGLLKYCNLIVRGYAPADENLMKNHEKYMCSRFFIDFNDIETQKYMLVTYLQTHFKNDYNLIYNYLLKLFEIVSKSTVCLMNHERKQTLEFISQLADTYQYHLTWQQPQQIQQQQQQQQYLYVNNNNNFNSNSNNNNRKNRYSSSSSVSSTSSNSSTSSHNINNNSNNNKKKYNHNNNNNRQYNNKNYYNNNYYNNNHNYNHYNQHHYHHHPQNNNNNNNSNNYIYFNDFNPNYYNNHNNTIPHTFTISNSGFINNDYELGPQLIIRPTILAIPDVNLTQTSTNTATLTTTTTVTTVTTLTTSNNNGNNNNNGILLSTNSSLVSSPLISPSQSPSPLESSSSSSSTSASSSVLSISPAPITQQQQQQQVISVNVNINTCKLTNANNEIYYSKNNCSAYTKPIC